MIKHTLYLGLNDKDTKTQKIGPLDAYQIAMQLIAANGYDRVSSRFWHGGEKSGNMA